jgi:nucleoside-diphosphate-sugar epimerase
MSNYEVGGEIFNVGTGENVSVVELARGVSEDIEFVPSRPGEAKETLADNTKIKSIGWKPTKNIEDWVKENIGQKKFSVSEKIY